MSPPSFPCSAFARYGFAAAAVAICFCLRAALIPWTGPDLFRFSIFHLAVMVAALIGGLGPGLLATAAAALVIDFWILPPVGSLAVVGSRDAVGLGLFICIGIFFSALAHLYERARRKASAYERELALRESEVRFQAFMDNSPAIAWIKDEEGRVVYLSKSFERMFGVTLEGCRGKTDLDLWSPEVARKFRENDLIVLATGQPREFFEEVRNLEGAVGHWWTFKFLIRDKAGRKYVAGSSVDITARRRAEEALSTSRAAALNLMEDALESRQRAEQAVAALGESERRFRAMFELASVGMAEADPRTGRFVRANEKMSEITGFSADEFVGMAISDLTHPEDRAGDWEKFQRAIHGETADYQNEKRYVRKDGAVVWVRVNAAVLRDAAGQAVRTVAVIEEITERKAAEEALRASEARYRRLHESMTDAIIEVDMTGRIVDFNPALQAMLGFSGDELRARTYVDLTPEKWHAMQARIIEGQVLTRGFSEVYQKEYRRKDGTDVPIELRTLLIRDTDGQPTGMWAVLRDITERKRAEDALRASELKHRRLHESITDAFVQTDMNGRIIDFNPAYQVMLGYPADELRERTYEDMTPEKWHAMEARIVAEQIVPLGHSDVYEKEYRRKDGSVFPIELRTFLIRDADGQPAAMWALVRDITERKRIEAALRESEEQFRAMFELAAVGMAQADPRTGRFLRVNDKMCSITGYPADELVGKCLSEITHPEDRARDWEALQKAVKGETPDLRSEKRYIRKDGRVVWVYVNAVIIRDGAGFPLRSMAVIEDITERKEAEEALRESQGRLAALIDAAMDAVVTVDEEQRIVLFNPAAETMFGARASEALGGPISQFIPERFRGMHGEHVRDFAATGDTSRHVGSLGLIYGLRRNGEEFPIEASVSKVEVGGQKLFTVILRDISRRIRAERELFETNQRLEAVMQAVPVGITFSTDTTCKSATGNPTLLAQFESAPGDNISASAPDPSAVGRRIRYFRNRRELGEDELPLQRAVAENRLIPATEIEVLLPSGRRWIAEISGAPVRDAQGTVIAGLAVVLDVTARRKAEKALRSSEARLRGMVETAQVGIAFRDDVGRVYEANEAFFRMVGYDRGEVLEGRVGWKEIVAPGCEDSDRKMFEQLQQAGRTGPVEKEYVRKDGSRLPVQVSLIRLPGWTDEHVAFIVDLTERKRAEEAVEEARKALERERDLLQSVMDGAKNSHLVFLDRDFNFVRVNNTYALTCGYEPAEMIGKNHFALYPDAENEALFARVRDTGIPAQVHDKPFVFPDQPERGVTYWDWTLVPVRSGPGAVIGLVFSLVETTERKRAELALRDSEERLNRVNVDLERRVETRTEQLRRLAARVASIQDEEHRRIAEGLHDGVAQTLVACTLKLAELRTAPSDARAQAPIRQIDRLLAEAQEAIRNLTFELTPATLERVGLEEALHELCDNMTSRHGVRFTFGSQGHGARLAGDVSTVLFKATRELMFNVVKHAGVKEAAILVARDASGLRITVEDRGKGIWATAGEGSGPRGPGGGLGLLSVMERMRSIGGNVSIDTAVQKGTRVSLVLPFAPKAGRARTKRSSSHPVAKRAS